MKQAAWHYISGEMDLWLQAWGEQGCHTTGCLYEVDEVDPASPLQAPTPYSSWLWWLELCGSPSGRVDYPLPFPHRGRRVPGTYRDLQLRRLRVTTVRDSIGGSTVGLAGLSQ